MGGGANFKIPDFKQYKVDGIKELEWTRTALERKGLKDPWLRNEVWRYQHWPGYGKNIMVVMGRGFKFGFAAFVATVIADKVFGVTASSDHH